MTSWIFQWVNCTIYLTLGPQIESDVADWETARQKSVKLAGQCLFSYTSPNQKTCDNTKHFRWIWHGFLDEDSLSCLKEIEDGAISVQAPIVDILNSDTQFEIDLP